MKFYIYNEISHQKLQNLIIEFDIEFKKSKNEKNIVDFSDIEHLALQILVREENGKIVPTEIAKKYCEKFAEIAIDEYQDSNLLQEYILNAISRGNNIFMVGDVKQSIYKFRQAMPELFLSKYKRYNLKENIDEKNMPKISGTCGNSVPKISGTNGKERKKNTVV